MTDTQPLDLAALTATCQAWPEHYDLERDEDRDPYDGELDGLTYYISRYQPGWSATDSAKIDDWEGPVGWIDALVDKANAVPALLARIAELEKSLVHARHNANYFMVWATQERPGDFPIFQDAYSLRENGILAASDGWKVGDPVTEKVRA